MKNLRFVLKILFPFFLCFIKTIPVRADYSNGALIGAVPHSYNSILSSNGERLYTVSQGVVGVTDLKRNVFLASFPLSGLTLTPWGIAYTNNKLFVSGDREVVVLNATNGTPLATIPFPFPGHSSQSGVVISADGHTAYSIGNGTDALLKIDTITYQAQSLSGMGRGYSELALAADGATLYLGNSSSGILRIVDLADFSLRSEYISYTGQHHFSSGFLNLVPLWNGQLLAAWNTVEDGYGRVTWINPNGTVARESILPRGSTGLAVSQNEHEVITGSGYIFNASTGSALGALPQPASFYSIQASAADGRGYILQENFSAIQEILGFTPMLSSLGETTRAVSPNELVTINLSLSPRFAGKTYQIALSGGNTGIQSNLGPVSIRRDQLYMRSTRRQISGLQNFVGTIGADGRTSATFRVNSEILNLLKGRTTFYGVVGIFRNQTRATTNLATVSNVMQFNIISTTR